MKSRHLNITLIVAVGLPLLLLHFQNCAPVRAPGSASAGTAYLPDSSKQLQFVTPDVQVQDDAAATQIDGFCDANSDGVILQWSLNAQSGSRLISGSSLCKGGQFALNLDGLSDVVCGIPHLLVVQGQAGSVGSASFIRRCQPLAAIQLPAPADSPGGTVCQLEYTPSNSLGTQCVQACYRASMLVSSDGLDLSQCGALAESLAGP